jgi:hypothetical protein
MHGQAVFAPVRVDPRALSLPAGFEAVGRGPLALGLLGYVRYEAPSPLTYDELIFMPAFVRAPGFGPRASGWFVSVMYVSERHTLEGGRAIWKLPKTMARFRREGTRLEVDAEDGTSIALDLRTPGPRVPARGSIATLQFHDGVSLCRFRGDSRAKVSLARMRVDAFRSEAPAWAGFDPARVASIGVAQHDFVSDMGVPTFVTRPR